MKKIVVVLVSLVVAVLVIGGNAFAQGKTSKSSIPEPSLGPEWKLVFTGSGGTTVYVDTRSITYLPEDIVKVRELWVPRGGFRRTLAVNILKNKLLSRGKDPNKAKRLWYGIELDKFNCKTHQMAKLEWVAYSFGQAVLDHESSQHEKWEDIVPGGATEIVEKYVCNEAPPSIPALLEPHIPEPSLSSEWKFVGISFSRTTYYVNTRKITYLPGGIVKVWQLWVPRGDFRRFWVNILKMILYLQGKDPNNAERFWYKKSLFKFNCKNHQFAPLETTFYSFGQAVLDHESYQHEEWDRIVPGSVGEVIEKYVCR